MDVDNVHSGMEYEVLKESYVIFLCLGDAIGNGLPVYTFRYRADEDTSILMNDGTITVFFDALNYDKMKSEKVRSFFKFLCGLNIKDNFTEKLSALVERLKVNAQRRHEYMTWEQEMKEQAHFLAEEIAEEKAIETAKNMLDNDISAELVEKCTGLPLEQVLQLQKEVMSPAAK